VRPDLVRGETLAALFCLPGWRPGSRVSYVLPEFRPGAAVCCSLATAQND